MGAPKQQATPGEKRRYRPAHVLPPENQPTAQAAANISVFRDSLQYIPWNLVIIFPMQEAMEQQMWTKGPSLPRGMPEPKVAVRPITLARKTLIVRYSGKTTPLRMTFISGSPEPTA